MKVELLSPNQTFYYYHSQTLAIYVSMLHYLDQSERPYNVIIIFYRTLLLINMSVRLIKNEHLT